MYSLIILIISIIPSLFDIKYIKSNLISLILTSILFSYILLGFISLFLISIDQSRFPLLVISSIILILTLLKDKKFFYKYIIIWNCLLGEFKYFIYTYKVKSNNFSSWVIFGLVLLITLSSIGPINHPDALDYHVGYIYQYWLKKGFFVDGGFHQGLLGIGDYANLSFIQERTIWLIRYIQVFSLPFIILFFFNSVKNNIFIIAFLSSSTFIQWSTIGKPLFLGEASAAVVYIFWKNNKNAYSKKLLILCLIACISIKISSLIVFLPIILDLIYECLNKNKLNFKRIYIDIKNTFYQRAVLITLFSLIGILISRYFINGNFAYPLLTEIFNSNDQNIKIFASFLSEYNRNQFFPLNIFLPLSLSTLSTSLGPGILILIISLFIFQLKKITIFKKSFVFTDSILFIGFLQLILLIIFCQGRADYYSMPVLLFVYSSNNLGIFIKNNIYKITLNLATYIQVILLSFILLFSIFQNISAIINLERNLQFTSSGYVALKYLDNISNGNVYQNLIRDARFYYPQNYIPQEIVINCFQKNQDNPNFKAYCLDLYKIKKFISAPNFLTNKEIYNCEKKTFLIGARNPFNRSKVLMEICKKK